MSDTYGTDPLGTNYGNSYDATAPESPGAATLRQSDYDFTSRVFPADLGQEDNAHYMIININVPADRNALQGQTRFPTGTVLQDKSTVDKLRFDSRFGRTDYNLNVPIVGGTVNQYDLSPPRYTRRIKESIALHMPNGGLVYTEPNLYEEISMTAIASGTVGTLLGGITSSIFGEDAGKKALSLFNSVGSAIKTVGQISATPINPRVEVLFSTRPQRQWVFEVFMLPRSEKEADTVKQIIQTIRYYAAPEISSSGFFFIPPAEFDITFFFNGKENQNLPRINTCVLERIDVDYAPENSYSTFRNGQSVATRMSLAFREIEILHKQRVYQGF